MEKPISRTRRALGLRAYLNLALAVTVVIFALATTFTYTQVESRIRADVGEHLDSLAAHFAGDTIATWLEQKRSMAKALAAYPAMREMHVEEAQRIINATYAAAPADYNNIGFFDATGLMVADIAGATGKGNLIKGNPWGQEVYDGRRTQSPELLSSLNNRPIFVLYERVMDASGAVVGVVGVGTDLTAISGRLEEARIGQTGEAILVNSQGLVLNKLRDTPDAILTLDLSGDRLTQLALGGQAGIVEMPDYRGVPVMAAYRPIPEYGWGVVVKQDADEAFAVLANLRAVFFGAIVGALAVALASNMIVQRRVSLALGRLIAGSQRLAAGELATPIEPLAIGEFGRLADEFNRMADALRRRVAELSALNAMAAIVNESLDVDEILNRALDEALRQVGVEAGAVLLLDEEAGELALVAHRGISEDFARAAQRLKLGEGLAGRAAQTGQPVVMGETDEYRGALKAFVEKDRIQSAASVPLLGRTGVIGVMNLVTSNPHYLDAAGLELLTGLGRQIAVGIEKARLFEAVQQELAERKRAEQELSEGAEELARSNKELEQFAYVASHDLQEPLRMVSSYTELLGRRYKGRLDADADEFIAYAVEGATRMQTMINDLLAYSRLGSQGWSVGPVDCDSVLAQALANLSVAIEESHARVTSDPLPTVSANETELAQLLQNLVSNAIKFRGEAPPAVHLSARRSGAEWVFAVRDNGIGIAPEHRERIFVIFQRLNPRDRYSGTGIGLAICRKIVDRHRGRIWVEPEPGGGSTFLFSIPEKEQATP